MQHRCESALAPLEHAARPALVRRAQQPRAHHRRGRERKYQRYEDRHRERHREFAEVTPDDAAHQQDRYEHRDQRQAHRQHGEADLARAQQCGLPRRHAGLDVTRGVLEHDYRVVDDKTGGDGQRHQRQIVEAVAGEIHRAEGGDQRYRHRHDRDQRCPAVAQEEEHHQDDQADRHDQRALDVAQAGPDRRRALHHHVEVDRIGDRAAQQRQECGHPIDRLDDVRVRLAIDDDQHRGFAIRRSSIAQVLHRVDDLGDIGQPHRRAVAISDDQREVFGRCLRLIVGVDLPVPEIVLDRALGPVCVGRREDGAHVLEADPIFVERLRLELDPHRRQCAAADGHLAHSFDLRELLGDDRRGRVVHLPLSHRARSERKDHDRRVGRVHLAVGRIARQPGGQKAPRRVDRRLNVARRAVDVAVEIELHDDARRPERAVRGHLRNPGDAPERALQRGSDGRRHRLRARTGERSLHRDRRKVHLRQRRHGQQLKRDRPGERDAQREERSRDRTVDEGCGKVHAGTAFIRPARRRRVCRHALSAAPPRDAPAGRRRGRSPGW